MYLLRALRAIVVWGWSPIFITVLAVAGFIYEWEAWLLFPVMVVVLVAGLVVMVLRAAEKQMEQAALRLRQLAGYFNRRFMGNSSLSIFAIIDSLFNIDNPKLWDWARACDMSARIFNTWGNSFIDRLEGDTRTSRFSMYLRTYLNELWLLNNHYYEFVEQFCEIAESVEIPREARDQYNRFVIEYNSFVQNFRDSIAQLKKVAKTEIEAPSVKMVRELSGIKPPLPKPDTEEKPPPSTKGGGYYL